MRHPSTCSSEHLRISRAFTLIELLVVIAIIGLLAAMIVPVLAKIKQDGKVKQAQMEIRGIANAISDYEGKYSRYPTAQPLGSGDFTYGGSALDTVFGGSGTWSANNSEVISILMDLERYPNGSGNTVNFGHVKNTRQIKFLNPTMVSDTVSPGVGPDLVYRDPWGNPYIISMDLNYDGKCRDAFYKLDAVSKQSGQMGYNGLNDSSGNPDSFEYNGGVMVWSLGPDKQGSANSPPGGNATAGVNRDNVLSWK